MDLDDEREFKELSEEEQIAFLRNDPVMGPAYRTEQEARQFLKTIVEVNVQITITLNKIENFDKKLLTLINTQKQLDLLNKTGARLEKALEEFRSSNNPYEVSPDIIDAVKKIRITLIKNYKEMIDQEIDRVVQQLLNIPMDKNRRLEAFNQQMEELHATPMPDEMKKDLEELARKMLLDGQDIQEAMGLSDKGTELFYIAGKKAYEEEKDYDRAFLTFNVLSNLREQDERVILGIAACLQIQKKYQDAITKYMEYVSINPKDPIAHYHAAECYKQIGLFEKAEEELTRCIEKSSGKEHVLVKKKAKEHLLKIGEDLQKN